MILMFKKQNMSFSRSYNPSQKKSERKCIEYFKDF